MSVVDRYGAVTGDYLAQSTATPSDFAELLKPRVMSLVVFTALCGMVVAPGHINPVVGLIALLAIAVGAGASGALNMVYDADVDAVMSRTRTRPIPDHRVSSAEALTFGLVLAVLSVIVLGLVANLLAGSLLAATIVFYAVVYTMWLKRSTPQNIVIGGAAGALPPIIGCAVATGSISWDSVLLFAIIFFWTPPHFWALALLKVDDYAQAKIPMMPNAKGPDRTRTEILVYSIVLALTACLPWATGLGGRIYGVTAVLAGAVFVGFAVQVYRHRTGEVAAKAARHLFGFSILYVFLLFAVLLAEHAFPGASLL